MKVFDENRPFHYLTEAKLYYNEKFLIQVYGSAQGLSDYSILETIYTGVFKKPAHRRRSKLLRNVCIFTKFLSKLAKDHYMFTQSDYN